MNHPNLPEAELEMLACLQHKGHATASELREALRPFRPLAHPSVVTLLQRLEFKGLVSREKGSVGKSFVYRPTSRSRATFGAKIRRLVQRAFAGDSVALVASLFETQPPSSEEIDKVQ
jgi:predicted transcriptional regulator